MAWHWLSPLEHSVAEHIAALPAAQAADALLPHVWFDPEWAVTAADAIAAHPHRDKVLDLLWAYHTSSPTPAQEIANRTLEWLVLDATAQTLPSDWSSDHKSLIHRLRVTAAPDNPQIVGRTARWTSSNAHAARAIRNALPGANPRAVRALVGPLPALDPTDTDRATARQAILNALPGANQFTVSGLVEALRSLDPTDTDRATARQAILNALPGANQFAVSGLAGSLPALVVTDTDRATARQAILNALPGTDRFTVSDLVEALRSLAPVLEWLGLLALSPHRC